MKGDAEERRLWNVTPPGESSGEHHWQGLKVTSNAINSLVDFNGLTVGILTYWSTFSKGWESCKANSGTGEHLQGGCSPRPPTLLRNCQGGHGHQTASLGTCSSYSPQPTKTRNQSLQKCLVYGQPLNTKGSFQDIDYCLSAKHYLAVFVKTRVQKKKKKEKVRFPSPNPRSAVPSWRSCLYIAKLPPRLCHLLSLLSIKLQISQNTFSSECTSAVNM